MGCALNYRSLSLWHDSEPGGWHPRKALPGSTDVDVAIVGGGFTGLWTAYYLKVHDPSLRVAVLEREVAGFGASGRNGGWCSALFPASWRKLGKLGDLASAVALQRALHETVDEVGRVSATEGIDCHYRKGGTVSLARTPVQLERARGLVAHARAWGFGADDVALLGPDEARHRLGASGVLGATYTPHCAAIHPARLVRGLADAAERRGVHIYEQTTATAIKDGRVQTAAGTVRAEVVVRATEGYTPGIEGHARAVAPVYSLMVATQPLSPDFWADTGLSARETFTDHRHLIVYGQRTADDRIAFGGRGAPYHFASRTRPEFDHEPRVFASLRRTLLDLFPALAGATFTHAWGGALGIPRDWCASVGVDRARRYAWGGGYVGDGVGTSNLAGRTLADLILQRGTPLVNLPWVGHRSPRWEPEPLRWLGINTGLRAMHLADAEERVTGRPSALARAVAPLTGGH
ncbi:MAG TPA: FAD-dependent oxidoreductase [Nocardioidaceae bacterium]|nr:FAD-dependent oxidoreductase [Nocardioidaceae bacterium]